MGPVATTIAHEMGHNFGLNHDTDTGCECPEPRCIMNRNSGCALSIFDVTSSLLAVNVIIMLLCCSGNQQPVSWSSCSLHQFDEVFLQGIDFCLHDLPQRIDDGPVCGNALLEEGEDCDCGTIQVRSTYRSYLSANEVPRFLQTNC